MGATGLSWLPVLVLSGFRAGEYWFSVSELAKEGFTLWGLGCRGDADSAGSLAPWLISVKQTNTKSKTTQNGWARRVQSFRHRFCVLPLNVTKNEKIFLQYVNTLIMIAQCSSNRDFSKLELPQGTAQESCQKDGNSFVSLFLDYSAFTKGSG